jgi:predicted transcriptional regulator
MQQIVDRVKTYEFRKKLYPPTVLRVWFYETAPISAITYICEIDPANVRGQDPPLPETGLGNKEYNSGDPTFKGYDFAYRVKSCWRLREAVKLEALKGYGIGGAPRGMVYVPEQLGRDIVWDKQEECEVLSVGRLMTPPPNTMH